MHALDAYPGDAADIAHEFSRCLNPCRVRVRTSQSYRSAFEFFIHVQSIAARNW
jgi:hypothetical protein